MSTVPPTIGRYKVTERLGEGGMGTVFLAFDPELERQVAIKILKDADDGDLRARFTREARSAARLRHPNIVTIFDVGQDEGRPFIAMEFLQGQTLADMIRENTPISTVRMLHLMEDVCAGLAYAHKAGLVHRDVKPANLMVDVDGTLKILDFGIARVAESGMTQAGLLIGTLSYMSPEQVQGQPLDGRSDMFAVGAVFYELLSRHQAFPGSVGEGIFHKLLNLAPTPLEKLCPWLRPEVIRIVNRAIEKDRDRRYPDLTAMRSEIQHMRLRLETEVDADSAKVKSHDATALADRPVTPTPVRRRINKDEIEARRGVQIAEHLNQARQAFEQGDYTAVVAQCEQVLVLNPDEPHADDLLDRARLAIDSRQAAQWLEEAGSRLKNNDLSGASSLLEQVLSVDPDARRALDVRGLIEKAREDRERRAESEAKARRDRELAPKSGVEPAQAAVGPQPVDAGLDSLRPITETYQESAVPTGKDRRAQLTLVAVAIVAVAVMLGFGIWWNSGQDPSAAASQQPTTTQAAGVPSAAPVAGPVAAVSNVPAAAAPAGTPAPAATPEVPATGTAPAAAGAPASPQPVDESSVPASRSRERATGSTTGGAAPVASVVEKPTAPPAPPVRKTPAVVQLSYDGEPFPLVVYAENRAVGRIEGPSDRLNVEAGRVRLRVEGQGAFFDHDFGVVNLQAGERRTFTLPGIASAFIGVRGDNYAGLRILIDGDAVPMPYPAQVPRIASGPHEIVFKWSEGGLEGVEITKKVDLSGGRHFSIRAVPEDAQVVVQKLR